VFEKRVLSRVFRPKNGMPGFTSLRDKVERHEGDYSFPTSAEIKNNWSSISTPSYFFVESCFINTRQFRLYPVRNDRRVEKII
jgi:hypothetical protein